MDGEPFTLICANCLRDRYVREVSALDVSVAQTLYAGQALCGLCFILVVEAEKPQEGDMPTGMMNWGTIAS